MSPRPSPPRPRQSERILKVLRTSELTPLVTFISASTSPSVSEVCSLPLPLPAGCVLHVASPRIFTGSYFPTPALSPLLSLSRHLASCIPLTSGGARVTIVFGVRVWCGTAPWRWRHRRCFSATPTPRPQTPTTRR